MTELYYLGTDFYWESSTVIGSLYDNEGNRWDWGLVQRYITEGGTLTIRPATDAEIGRAYKQLQELTK